MQVHCFSTVLLMLMFCGCVHRPAPSTMVTQPQRPMERVTGIGGVFFKARDPARLGEWYRQHLGVVTDNGHADFIWRERDRPDQMGRTVWSLFPANTDYLGRSSASFMINYRVANLDRMLEQLRRNGIVVEKIEDYGYGRFAWITDPEGNRIELWEPK